MEMPSAFTKRRKSQGFSLLEMLFATVILLVGLVAIAQLVPASIYLNYQNRNNSSALVFAQRELDQMLDQPLNPIPPTQQFQDAEGNICQLGNPAITNTVQGTHIVTFQNQAVIDFTSSAPGYNFTYLEDPTIPNGLQYDVRWAVIITGNGTTVSSKRFILGIRQQGGTGYFPPITLDAMVEK
jgi:prepilin-type N-terminal cleavage/methylation domain-containing protein